MSSASRRQIRPRARPLAPLLAAWLALSPALASAQAGAARPAAETLAEGCASEEYDPETCRETMGRLERLVRQDPKRDDARLALARAFWNAGQAAEAAGEEGGPADARELKRRSLDLYRRLGDSGAPAARKEALYELGQRIRDDGERAAALQKVVELDPRNAAAQRDLGFALLATGKPDEALSAYRRAQQLEPRTSPDDALQHVRFAQGLAEAGRPAEAVRIYRGLLDPAGPATRRERCLALQPVETSSYGSFPDFVRQVEALRPHCNGLEHRDRAVELERSGQPREAIRELEEQLRKNPVYDETYFLLEGLLRRSGQPERAAEVVRRYFDQEKDPAERCRNFRFLPVAARGALGGDRLARLGRECKVPLPEKKPSGQGGKTAAVVAGLAIAGVAAALLARGGGETVTDRLSGTLAGRNASQSHPLGPFREGRCRAEVTWKGSGAVSLAVVPAGGGTPVARAEGSRPGQAGSGGPLRLEWTCARGVSYVLGVFLRPMEGRADYGVVVSHPPAR